MPSGSLRLQTNPAGRAPGGACIGPGPRSCQGQAAGPLGRRTAQGIIHANLPSDRRCRPPFSPPPCSPWACCPPRPETTYRFSPVNQWDINKTAAYWNPIIQYVSEKSGVKLQLKIGRTSADTTSYVLAQEVEFMFSNHLFSPEREALGWKVFGAATPGAPQPIAVPADSPITKLEGAPGQEVALPAPRPSSATRCRMRTWPRRRRREGVFGGNQNAAIAQMFAGKAKATGSNSMLIEGYAQTRETGSASQWTSRAYHDLALMASAGARQGTSRRWRAPPRHAQGRPRPAGAAQGLPGGRARHRRPFHPRPAAATTPPTASSARAPRRRALSLHSGQALAALLPSPWWRASARSIHAACCFSSAAASASSANTSSPSRLQTAQQSARHMLIG